MSPKKKERETAPKRWWWFSVASFFLLLLFKDATTKWNLIETKTCKKDGHLRDLIKERQQRHHHHHHHHHQDGRCRRRRRRRRFHAVVRVVPGRSRSLPCRVERASFCFGRKDKGGGAERKPSTRRHVRLTSECLTSVTGAKIRWPTPVAASTLAASRGRRRHGWRRRRLPPSPPPPGPTLSVTKKKEIVALLALIGRRAVPATPASLSLSLSLSLFAFICSFIYPRPALAIQPRRSTARWHWPLERRAFFFIFFYGLLGPRRSMAPARAYPHPLYSLRSSLQFGGLFFSFFFLLGPVDLIGFRFYSALRYSIRVRAWSTTAFHLIVSAECMTKKKRAKNIWKMFGTVNDRCSHRTAIVRPNRALSDRFGELLTWITLHVAKAIIDISQFYWSDFVILLKSIKLHARIR